MVLVSYITRRLLIKQIIMDGNLLYSCKRAILFEQTMLQPSLVHIDSGKRNLFVDSFVSIS